MTFSQIARLLHRHPSSISRELKRHSKQGNYSRAQTAYHLAKSHCGRKRKLEIDTEHSQIVKHLFLECQWSPEEIEGRLRLERERHVISYQPFIELSIAVTLTTRLFYMVLVGLFANFVTMVKHAIQNPMWKSEEKFLFLIPFMRDQ